MPPLNFSREDGERQMTLPTTEQAASYVRQIEATWEGFQPTEIKGLGIRRDAAGFGETRLVVTNNATWDVWFTETGEIYGEC